MTGRVTIRVVDAAAPEAVALVTGFFAEVAARYPGFDPALQPPAPTDGFTAAHGGTFLIADVDGSPAGCAGFKRLDDTTAELRRVFVAAAARGHGVGRALLDRAVDDARAAGYTRIRLDTGARLVEALALFRSRGFVEIADYNGNPYAEHWLELRLDDAHDG